MLVSLNFALRQHVDMFSLSIRVDFWHWKQI